MPPKSRTVPALGREQEAVKHCHPFPKASGAELQDFLPSRSPVPALQNLNFKKFLAVSLEQGNK